MIFYSDSFERNLEKRGIALREEFANMLSMGFLVESLKSSIKRMKIMNEDISEIDNIAFINSERTPPIRPDTLFICEKDYLEEFLKNATFVEGATILIAGDDESVPLPEAPPVNLITTSCGSIELYEMFAGVITETERWKVHFLETMLIHNDVHSILSYGASLVGAGILYLSSKQRVISKYAAGNIRDPLLDQAQKTGQISKANYKDLVEKPYGGIKPKNNFKRFTSLSTKNTYYRYHIMNNDEVLSTIFIITDENAPMSDIWSLAVLMGRSIKKTLQTGCAERQNKDDELYTLFSSIMDNTISVQDIKDKLRLAPNPVQRFCSIGIIEFEGCMPGAIPYGHIMRNLSEVFPNTNMLVYDGCIIILITFDERRMRVSFNDTKMREILELHNGCFGISNATRNRAMFRTLFILAKTTIRLAKVLRTNQQERIFFYEDYSMYHIIDLCARSFQEIHHHDDLIYLIHPSIVEISRYDLKHNDNLLDVLYYYLLYDRNLVKTANKLYMHRNTVVNKVNKLTRIVDSDLKNGELQQRLMFSCQFMRYIRLYLEKVVLLD